MSGFSIDAVIDRRGERGRPFRLHAQFDSPPGITVVFGPSGSGKTTLLLSILGALKPSEGRIRCGGLDVFDSVRALDLPIRERRVGMVFQDALLFPHLDVLHNVAFGLRGADRRTQARAMLERVDAGALLDRRPADLSGGERQRVALARSLAAAPQALLLDEPFSALDRAARESLADLLLELQADTRIPFLHVTHDLGEAMRLGDRLVLLGDGVVVQTGPPAQVVARPGSLAAARAVGTENLFTATVIRHFTERGCTEVDLGGTRVQTGLLDLQPGARLALGLRAEDILLSLEPLHQTSARNVVTGVVQELRDHGHAVELRVTTPVSMRVIVTPISVRELGLEPGRSVYLLIKAAAFHRLV